MKDEKGSVRITYLRPLLLAAGFTVAGGTMVFVLWGLVWYPDENTSAKLLWSAIDAAAMAASAGLMVGFVVGRRYQGLVAGVVSSFCYAIALVAVGFISYEIDLTLDIFGVRRDGKLFILTGIVPTLMTAPLYGWLLHSATGKTLLSRIGL